MCAPYAETIPLYFSEIEAFVVCKKKCFIFERSESPTETQTRQTLHLRGETVENGISRYLLGELGVTSSQFLPCSRGREWVCVCWCGIAAGKHRVGTVSVFWEKSSSSPSVTEPGRTRKTTRQELSGKMSAGPGNRSTNTEPWGSFDENLIQVS